MDSTKQYSENEIRYFSMFTGIGGFELGFETANALSITSWNEPRGNEEDARGIESVGVAPQQFTCRERTSDKICNGSRKCEEGYGESETLIKSLQESDESTQHEGDTSCIDGRQKKFRCVGMSEFNKYSSQVLKYKFPTIKNWGDCTKINPSELPDFDMLCGGFPCQAFSIAGKRRGFEDTRGTMFFEVARVLKIKRPKIILLENVKGLLNHNKGETFRVILQTLDELGYEVQWMVLNSKFFGVPQNRERILIIGNLRGTSRSEILPFIYNDSETIGEGAVTRTFTAGGHSGGLHSDSTGIICYKKSKSQQERIYETEGVSPTLAGASKLSGDCTPRIRAVLTPDRPEKRQNGRRFKEPGEPSFTLTGQDIHGICKTVRSGGRGSLSKKHEWDVINTGYSIRRLTPTECCRLQGFPDDWNEYGIDEKGNKVKMSDTQRYKQLGNAVTTNVIEAIGIKTFRSPFW